MIFIGLIIFLGVLSLLYFLILLRFKNKVYNTLVEKYQEYKDKGRVVLCYVDDEFDFKKDPFIYIEIEGDTFIVRGKKYNISEVKDVKYKFDDFNFNLRDTVYVKIFFDIINIFISKLNRRQIRIREILIILRILLASHSIGIAL